MTIVTYKLRVMLDSFRNSCDVFGCSHLFICAPTLLVVKTEEINIKITLYGFVRDDRDSLKER